MKKFSYAVLFFSVFVFAVSLAVFSLSLNWGVIQRESFYVSFNITNDTGGFDVNSSALTFGKISRGGSSTRNVIFENNRDFPVVAKINSQGRITNMLVYGEYAMIEKGEAKKIPFGVSVPEDAEEGFYEGSVEFEIFRG